MGDGTGADELGALVARRQVVEAELLAADAERVVDVLARTGAEAVE